MGFFKKKNDQFDNKKLQIRLKMLTEKFMTGRFNHNKMNEVCWELSNVPVEKI